MLEKYYVFKTWESYDGGGVDVIPFDKISNLKQYLIEEYKTVDKIEKDIKYNKLYIFKGNILKPNITEKEIIKEISF